MNLISACIRVGRIIFDVCSGKENINWTQELLRISGDLIGTIPGFGVIPGVVGAVTNTGLNYWFDQYSGDRAGAQILGGFNYFLEGPDVQSSLGYYLKQLNKVTRGLFSPGSQAPAGADATGTPPPGSAPPPPPEVTAMSVSKFDEQSVRSLGQKSANTANPTTTAPREIPYGQPANGSQSVSRGSNLTRQGPKLPSASVQYKSFSVPGL
ncbi:MAG: hypothetical protein H7Z43_08980 [Clostridia bacterium]|nr:hypothetical protein [Deltaproteobacteria bacterium]